MLLNQFESRFPTEDSCREYFRLVREKNGVLCPECQKTTSKWQKSKNAFQCTHCGCYIPLTKGTVMERSKLPVKTWFYTMHLMTSIKQVLSAKEVQHQLGMDQYPPVWLMMMKLRSIMGKRDAIYQLSDEVELDEAFFPIRVPEEEKGQPLKRGAGSQKQAKVLVIVESKPVDKILEEYLQLPIAQSVAKISKLTSRSKTHAIKKSIHYIKMYVIDNLSADTIDKLAQKAVAKETVVITDGASAHNNFEEYFAEHEANVEYDKETVVKAKLPWVHVVIGRCRDGIAAIHREVDKQFLQLYLNEFCWKFNRRFFRDSTDPKYDLFDRLVSISASYTSNIKWRDYEIINDEELY